MPLRKSQKGLLMNSVNKLFVHPAIIIVLGYCQLWAFQRGLPFNPTSVMSTEKKDKALGRISDTHKEGRAFDLSIRGWTTDDIDDFKVDIEKELGHLGAVSESDLVRRLVVVESDHLHIQVDAALPEHDIEPYATLIEDKKELQWGQLKFSDLSLKNH